MASRKKDQAAGGEAAPKPSRKKPGMVKLTTEISTLTDTRLYDLAKRLETTKAALAARLIDQGMGLYTSDKFLKQALEQSSVMAA